MNVQTEMFDGSLVMLDELEAARRIGVKRRFLTAWRNTDGEKGVDWFVRKGLVGITMIGLRKFCAASKLSPPSDEEGMKRVFTDGAVSLVVRKVPAANNRILVCRRVGSDVMVNVFVRNNKKFKVGHEFDAIESKSGEIVLECGNMWPARRW